MVKCNCKYFSCGGQDIPQRTEYEHAKKDCIAKVKASLAACAVVAQPLPISQPSGSQVPSPRLDSSPSPTPLPSQHVSLNASDPEAMPISCLSASLRGHTSAIHHEVDVAEDQGCQYKERQMLSLNCLEDIGDLVEVKEQDKEMHGSEPSLSIASPHLHTLHQQYGVPGC
jgi:hypothetical protein